MRLHVEEQTEDARLYRDPDGVRVLALPPGLLSEHAERVLREALLVADREPIEVAPYPREKLDRQLVD